MALVCAQRQFSKSSSPQMETSRRNPIVAYIYIEHLGNYSEVWSILTWADAEKYHCMFHFKKVVIRSSCFMKGHLVSNLHGLDSPSWRRMNCFFHKLSDGTKRWCCEMSGMCQCHECLYCVKDHSKKSSQAINVWYEYTHILSFTPIMTPNV